MSYTLERTGPVLVVAITGQLVVGDRQAFKEAVLAHVDAGARTVVLDLAATDYVDSSGLGVFVSLSKRLRDLGGQLRLAALNADLRALFELTRLDTLFPIHASRADALAAG